MVVLYLLLDGLNFKLTEWLLFFLLKFTKSWICWKQTQNVVALHGEQSTSTCATEPKEQ